MVVMRAARAEARNRMRDEMRRVINSIEKVRKWERRWVVVKDTTMKVYKWVPVTDSSPTIKRPVVPISQLRENASNDNKNGESSAEDPDALGQSDTRGSNTNDAIMDDSRLTDIKSVSDVASFTHDDSRTGYSDAGFDDSNIDIATGTAYDPQNAAAVNSAPQTDFSMLSE